MAAQTETILMPAPMGPGISPADSAAPTPSYETMLPGPVVVPGAAPTTTTLRKVALTAQLSGVNFASSAVNGLVTVGLPAIAADVGLAPALQLWPVSVYGLATGSTLLLAGSVADVVGARAVDLAGCFAVAALVLAAGFARTGAQLVALRALQGVAMSLHLCSSVSIVAAALPRGRGRNVAFSCLGLSQPLGFSLGLVLGGVFVDTVGWRAGWFLFGGIALLLALVGPWALPKTDEAHVPRDMLHDLATRVDWVGAGIASAFMTSLSYLLAVLSTDADAIRKTETIVLLCLSAVALPAFLLWVQRQVRLGRPALIPNALWKNLAFSSICATVVLSFAVLGSMELFASLFFQEVQSLSALQASLRLLPSLVVGATLNLTTGLLVDRVPALVLVTASSVLCAGSPLLMAVVQPEWPYWAAAFAAQVLQPVSGDVLFTVGLVIVSDVFPERTQALAGAVFNMATQFGIALGLVVMQVISARATAKAEEDDRDGIHSPTDLLMAGYRASFWAMFASMIACTAVGAFGLRRTGMVGLKTD